jgi:hypothetical protein
MELNEFVQTSDVVRELTENLVHYKKLSEFLATVIADSAIPGFVYSTEGIMSREALIETVLDWAAMNMEEVENSVETMSNL